MTRILLVGAGPLPEDDPVRMGFPNLRTGWFLQALCAEGHEVVLATLDPTACGRAPLPASPAHGPSLRLDLDPADATTPGRLAGLARVADAIVSAGPFTPARIAATCAGDRPLWVDLPGDPFAEAAARRVARPGESDPTDAWVRATALAIARGDAFSTCSGPQRHALLGQLGLLGRPLEDLLPRVHSIPPALGGQGLPEGASRTRPAGAPLVLAVSGGWNTWLDEETLLVGVLSALDRGAPLRVVVLGGSIPGHHDGAWERFVSTVDCSAHRAAFELRGWVRHRDLPAALASAHVFLNVDRPGPEPELGSRTRLLFAIHQGLSVATTPCTEVARDLLAAGLGVSLPVGDPASLADALVDLATRATSALPDASRREVSARYAPEAVTRPLRAWAACPSRAPGGVSTADRLARRVEELEQALAAVHQSPTWRTLAPVHRGIRRLLGGRLRG